MTNPRGRQDWAAAPRRRRLRFLPLLLLAIPLADFAMSRRVEAISDCRLVIATDAGTILAQCAPVIWPGDYRLLRLAGPEAPSLWNPGCLAEFRAALGQAAALRLAIWRAGQIEITPFGISDAARLRLNGRTQTPAAPPEAGYCPAQP